METLLNKGFRLYVDNWLTSQELFNYLRENNTVACGTACKTRIKLPREFKGAPLEKGEHSFQQNGDLLAIRFNDKKDILLVYHSPGKHGKHWQAGSTNHVIRLLKRSWEKGRPWKQISQKRHVQVFCFIILQYHEPPSWIACRSKTRLDGHLVPRICFVNMAEGLLSAAWSKSLKGIPYFDATFIKKWLEKDGKVPKKVIARGYSNFCEGYIFDVKGKFQSCCWVVFALGEKLYANSGTIHAFYAFYEHFILCFSFVYA